MKVFTYIMMVGALCCLFCYSKEKEDAPTGATFNKTFVTGYLTPESIVNDSVKFEVVQPWLSR